MKDAIVHLRSADATLAAIIASAGEFKIAYREPTFEALARSITYQQLSGKAAGTIYGRLVAAAGGEVTPESILKLSPRKMRAVGLSKQKLTYIRDLAKRTASGELNFAELKSLSDEDVITRLTAVKGIGLWTAQMFLIFALRRINVLPTGDLGVRAAIRKHYRK